MLNRNHMTSKSSSGLEHTYENLQKMDGQMLHTFTNVT